MITILLNLGAFFRRPKLLHKLFVIPVNVTLWHALNIHAAEKAPAKDKS
jgi:hypothetical protein